MAWVRIESSVSRHRKFQKAGPSASWLWFCGLAYCQEGLTDGFIPTESLPYLGVKSPHRLASELVNVGLWDKTEDGWQVHDYLKHNKPSAEIQRIIQERRVAGAAGGRASSEGRRGNVPKQVATAHDKQHAEATTSSKTEATVEPSSNLLCSALLCSAHISGTDERIEQPLDEAFSAFQEAYPSDRRKGGYLVQQAFVHATKVAGGVSRLMAALANHVHSEQWQIEKIIPGMDVWLSEERWRQELPAAGSVSSVKPDARPAWIREAEARKKARGGIGAA